MEKVETVNGSSRFKVPYGYNFWLDYWKRCIGEQQPLSSVSVIALNLLYV